MGETIENGAAGGDNPVTGGKMDWINLRAWVRLYRMKITRVNSKDVDQKQAERGRRSLILRPHPLLPQNRGPDHPTTALLWYISIAHLVPLLEFNQVG